MILFLIFNFKINLKFKYAHIYYQHFTNMYDNILI
jgi:hypothetical protein